MPIQNSKRSLLSAKEYVNGILKKDRAILAKTITLIESNRPHHRQISQQILKQILPKTGKAIRVGITGVPGVGKSTFIECLGMSLLEKGHHVAVLAVDPTSSVRGGSILGDKTRMPYLSRDPRAFIRPSPSQGSLGGVHRKTRETILACEAYGFDVILVETVGVGQSETSVSEMIDTFLVLLLAGAGDELQGIKKGILEVADILAINKSDGDNIIRAKQARRDYQRALHFIRPTLEYWPPPVMTCSALKQEGIADVWQAILHHRQSMIDHGDFETKRQKQRLQWMWSLVEQQLLTQLHHHPDVNQRSPFIEKEVLAGRLPPTLASEQLLHAFGTRLHSQSK